MNLRRVMYAHFLALQSGALVVCMSMMLVDAGPPQLIDIPTGVGVWIVAQLVVLPLAVVSFPIAALLRMICGFAFEDMKTTALAVGTMVGFLGGLAFALSETQETMAVLRVTLVSSLAGLVGGWVWWRVEGPSEAMT